MERQCTESKCAPGISTGLQKSSRGEVSDVIQVLFRGNGRYSDVIQTLDVIQALFRGFRRYSDVIQALFRRYSQTLSSRDIYEAHPAASFVQLLVFGLSLFRVCVRPDSFTPGKISVFWISLDYRCLAVTTSSNSLCCLATLT